MEFPGEKLVIKLWETLAEKGVGTLLSPWQERRSGQTRVELRRREMLALAQTELDVVEIRAGRKVFGSDGVLRIAGGGAAQPDGRIEPTFNAGHAISIERQAHAAGVIRASVNVSRAAAFAEEQLAQDSMEPTPKQVDEDWLLRWRDYASKVSGEDLQRLWGSVLAGEVKAPGRSSFRTLEFLNHLSKEEAEEISKVAPFVVDNRIHRDQSEYMQAKGVGFNEFLFLQELGLLAGVEAASMTTTYSSALTSQYQQILISHGKALVFTHPDPNLKLAINVYLLTKLGEQIFGLGAFHADEGYLTSAAKSLAANQYTVLLGDVVRLPDNRWQLSNAAIVAQPQPGMSGGLTNSSA